MGAALVLGDGMNFIKDYRFCGPEKFPAARRGQQNVERLRRGDQNVRRPAQHQLALARRRIAGAYGDANRRQQNSLAPGKSIDLRKRSLKIASNIVAESL